MSNPLHGSDESLLLKGGEIVRIRHVILMGVFLGAASFFPDNAFAEKNGSAGQPVTQKSEVHTQVIRKADSPEATNKEIPVNPDSVNKKPEQAGQKPVQKPVQKPDSQPTQSIKSVQKLPDKTDRSNEKVIPSIKNKIKAGKPPESAVMRKGQAPIQAKPKVVTAESAKASKVQAPSKRFYEADEYSHIQGGTDAKPEISSKNVKPSFSKKKRSTLRLAKEPLIEGKHETPSGDKKNPRFIEIISNSPQRTQTPGGQSNEQISSGSGTISFIAGLLEWNDYFGGNHARIHNSCHAYYFHQWINAPPSPPPKAAPFFLMFTA